MLSCFYHFLVHRRLCFILVSVEVHIDEGYARASCILLNQFRYPVRVLDQRLCTIPKVPRLRQPMDDPGGTQVPEAGSQGSCMLSRLTLTSRTSFSAFRYGLSVIHSSSSSCPSIADHSLLSPRDFGSARNYSFGTQFACDLWKKKQGDKTRWCTVFDNETSTSTRFFDCFIRTWNPGTSSSRSRSHAIRSYAQTHQEPHGGHFGQ
ncbi:hypothetical protein BJY04DRAFT_140601 [Aspergillus karnatakaensis]|uniref:uncharacterized protein n=1 Tax=Aspergillus karnatakaensis TaxID=1810916 RepID=UPI003CCE453D